MTFLLSMIVAASLTPAPIEIRPTFEIFGISTEELDHYPQGRSSCLKWDKDRVFCPTGWQLGSVRMESISFLYVYGKLAEVHGFARFGEFTLMVETLTMKYGKPEQAGENFEWHFRDGTLVARKIKPDFMRNLADSEFQFISRRNSELTSRSPVVNF